MSQLVVANYQNIKTAAISHFSSGRKNKRAMMVTGAPGGGKTALGKDVAASMGFSLQQTALMRPAFYTPVDCVGVPEIHDGVTRFAPPDFIHKLTTGEILFLIVDELPDAPMSVQNIFCGMVYDYDVAGLKIHPDMCIFVTGNRVQDKSGAGRVSTKFANRVYQYELAKSVKDFVDHGTAMQWDQDMLAFVSWQGEAALYGEDGFDPNSQLNASPRQWEEVCFIDKSLPAHIYLNQLKALIPQGIAETYLGFLRTIDELPPISEVMNNPETAPISEKIDVNYALTSRLIKAADSVAAFQKLMKYMLRLPVEMQTLYVTNIAQRDTQILSTPEYVKWCTTNQAYYGSDA